MRRKRRKRGSLRRRRNPKRRRASEMAGMERTLVIVKPDAVNRSLVGEILSRFERKGLKIVAMKMEHLAPYKLKEHYAQHKDKEFYEELIKYMSSIPSI